MLSSNLSWSPHIESIVKNVSPLIDILKKLKHDLDRKTIETTYFSFIRPKMEYGCHIWDNCGKCDSELLENMQLNMARVVTGARKGTSHELLYRETNWHTLSHRRDLIKLKTFIRIANGESPNYLRELLPRTFGSLRDNSRNPDNYLVPKTRTETFRSSFFPSSIRIWNSKNPEERTIENVKLAMKTRCNDLFYLGERKVNIIQAQLRLKCSKLNGDLFSLHVIDSPACPCGHGIEDCTHFLFQCPLYFRSRHKMLEALYRCIDVNAVNTEILLFGSETYDYDMNCLIFKSVHTYISESGRF